MFLAKARDFHQTMRWAVEAENWNAAGLAAVHCAIFASDAVLVKVAGVRSVSANHQDAVNPMRTHVTREGVAAALKHFEAILAVKGDIEYSERELMEARTMAIVKHAERFFEWAEEPAR